MFLIQSLNLQGRFLEIIRRFPSVLAFAILTTFTLILTIDDDSGKLFRWPVAAFIGFLLFLAWTLYCESYPGTRKYFWPGVIVILIFLGFYYYFMPDSLIQKTSCFWYFSLGLSIILHLIISFIPYLRNYNKITFVNYNISLFTGWMQSALYAILLFLALSLAILALDNLFDLQIRSILYFKLFILITGLFQSTLFLSDIPDDFADTSVPAPKSVLKVIVFYLFIPVTVLYGLIIYAYLFRVLLTSHEMVDWTFVMILWYFAVGILAWLLAAYFENPESNFLISRFRRWFFPSSIFPSFFLFVSLYKNINLFGLKEEFYLSAVASFFIACILVYYLIAASKDLRIIPLFAIIFCVVSFWSGPLSVCEVPVKNQQNRLISDMQKAGLIQNGILTIDTLRSYQDSAGMMTQKLYYLESRDALGFIKDYDKSGFITYNRDNINLDGILSLLRLNSSNDNPGIFFEYTHNKANSYDINGFEKIIPIISINDSIFEKDYLMLEDNHFNLYLNGVKEGKLDIDKEIIKLSDNAHNINIIEKEMSGYQLRIIVISASGQRLGTTINNLYISGYVLLRKVDK